MQKLIIITADSFTAAQNWVAENREQLHSYHKAGLVSVLNPILTHQGFIDEAQWIAKNYHNGLVYFMYQDDLLREVHNLTTMHTLTKKAKQVLETEAGITVEHTIDINDITMVDIVNGEVTIGSYRDENQLDRLIELSNSRCFHIRDASYLKDEVPYVIEDDFVRLVLDGIANYYRVIGELLPEVKELYQQKQQITVKEHNDIIETKLKAGEIPTEIVKYGFAHAWNFVEKYQSGDNEYIKPEFQELLTYLGI